MAAVVELHQTLQCCQLLIASRLCQVVGKEVPGVQAGGPWLVSFLQALLLLKWILVEVAVVVAQELSFSGEVAVVVLAVMVPVSIVAR